VTLPLRVVVARALDRVSRQCERWATALYRRHSRIEAQKAARESAARANERRRRDAIAVEDLIADVARQSRVKH